MTTLTVSMGAVEYRATVPTPRDALTLARAVHDALTALGMEPWVELPAGVFVRDEWDARRAPERRPV